VGGSDTEPQSGRGKRLRKHVSRRDGPGQKRGKGNRQKGSESNVLSTSKLSDELGGKSRSHEGPKIIKKLTGKKRKS